MNSYTIEGFNDINYEELRGYDTIYKVFENLIQNYGYKQVHTPTFESYDMYDINGAFPRQNMIKLIDNDGQVLVLRPDATIPITRMSATCHKDPQEVLKFGYITTIFRRISSKTDFRKEFMQAGVEYFGNNLPECDAEIISLAINILTSLGIDKIRIDIGEVSYLNALFDEIQVDKGNRVKILNYIEHKNIGDLREYLSSIEIPKSISDILCKIPMLFGNFQHTVDNAQRLAINDRMRQSVDYMKETYEIVKNYGYEDYLYADLGFTNQLNYYTGLIFKGYIGGIGESVLSGGRYNDLSLSFGIDRPASGFGINISLLADYLKTSYQSKPYFDLLLIYDSESVNCAIKTANEFRALNISTDYLNSKYEDSIKSDTYNNIARFENGKLYLDKDRNKVEIDVARLRQIIEEDSL